MRRRPHVAFTVLSLVVSAHAYAKPTGNPPAARPSCSPTGDWVLKVAPVPEASQCGNAKVSRKATDERFTVAKKVGGAVEIRGVGPSVAEEHLRVTTNDLGGCRLNYEFTENISTGTPLLEHVEYELLEMNGVVSGIRVTRTLADDPASPPVCTEVSVVVGGRKPLFAADLAIDQAKVRDEFLSYYTKLMKQTCKLPVDAGRKRDIVAIRMTVGRSGELKSLWIDGVDQRITENCDAVVAEGRSPVVRNPTDKDQTLEFAVHLP